MAVVAVGVGDVDVGDGDVGHVGSVASLGELGRAVSSLAAESLGRLAGEELLALVRGLEVVRRRLDAVTDRLAGVVDSTGAFGVDGHGSSAAALRHLGRLSGAEARARVRTARVLSRLPAVAAAYAAGVIPSGHVRAIVRVVSNPRVAGYLEVADPVFAEQAATETYEAFVAWLREWERLADADGTGQDADATHARRNAAVHVDADGATALAARLGGLEGAVVAEVFDRYVEAEWHADWAAARDRFGDAVTEAMLPRTAAQRRADALVAVFRAAATAQRGGSAVPLVNIVIDQVTLEEQLARLGGGVIGPRRTPEDLDPAGRRCHTLGGNPIHPREAVAAALAGQVRRVVVDGAGRIVDLGRRRRLFTGAARDAAMLQGALAHPDGLRCQWPGCLRRWHLQVDHIHSAARGGPTDQTNAQILCGTHNRLKEHGYTPTRAPNGTWTIHRPDGTPITPAA